VVDKAIKTQTHETPWQTAMARFSRVKFSHRRRDVAFVYLAAGRIARRQGIRTHNKTKR